MDSAISRLVSAPAPSVEELREISVFSDLPEEGLAWLASQMGVVDMTAGELAVRAGEPADYLIVMLKGEIHVERKDGAMYVARAGQVTGMLPFSRLVVFPYTTRAVVDTRVAGLRKERFSEMLQRLPVLQERLVNVMADRIRETTALDHQREKMIALGKLSAGLAHELNNPASAAQRAAHNLRNALKSVRTAALKLDREGLPLESRVFLAQLEKDWGKQAQAALDSLERSEQEEEIATWLERHNIEQHWDLAATFVDLGCKKETLEEVADRVPEKFLSDVLTRITAAFTISRLAEEIENSAGRITELVRAVKEYSYMDQMPEQEIDIHDGIENTLIMLRHKLKKGVNVVRDYERTLPKVCARGSELNQIWTNLIVNSIDAMDGKGKLVVRTRAEGKCARVEVVDDGPGIAPEIQPRIFEPFFTTKPVGEGTGLGLDTVYRVAKNHGGNVSFESRPGETRFVVRIPLQLGSRVAG
jgi:signal transduction histidine kinase